MTAYRTILRWIPLLSMAGGLVVFVPPAPAQAARPAPTGSVSLTVVASSRKGLGGRYVYSPDILLPQGLARGPDGVLYFVANTPTGDQVMRISAQGHISVLATACPESRTFPGDEFSNLAVTPRGVLYGLFDARVVRIGPHPGMVKLVPLRTSQGRRFSSPPLFHTKAADTRGHP